MKILHMVAALLVGIGAINWGLIGLSGFVGGGANWNAVNLLLGTWPQVEWLVYILVGLSGVWLLVTHKKDCKMCMSK